MKIDRNFTSSLQEQAERSGNNEAFKILAKIGDCRIGAGARVEPHKEPTFFIEVLLSLCTGHNPVNLDDMSKKLSMLKRLKQDKYVLSCEEDGCVSCELAVQSKSLAARYAIAKTILEKHVKVESGRSVDSDRVEGRHR